MNESLLDYVSRLAEAQRARAALVSDEGPRLAAEVLERAAQLLRFTGAPTAAEFWARVEANEQWAREEAYARGYAEGQARVDITLVSPSDN